MLQNKHTLYLYNKQEGEKLSDYIDRINSFTVFPNRLEILEKDCECYITYDKIEEGDLYCYCKNLHKLTYLSYLNIEIKNGEKLCGLCRELINETVYLNISDEEFNLIS